MVGRKRECDEGHKNSAWICRKQAIGRAKNLWNRKGKYSGEKALHVEGKTEEKRSQGKSKKFLPALLVHWKDPRKKEDRASWQKSA